MLTVLSPKMMRSRVEDFNPQKQSPRIAQEALFLDQIHISLQKPFPERCDDVQRMINELSIKDLHVFYPHLLASIFNVLPNQGWSLHTPHSRSLEGFRHFLGPRGPVWGLVEKLARDSFLRYEFPVSCLPKPTQRLLAEGIIPPLYHNKVQFTGESRTPLVICLGAVEYFLYQFAYFITQSASPWPCLQATDIAYRKDNTRTVDRSHDTIYTALFSNYLDHFLPTRQGTLVQPNLENRTPRAKFTPRFLNKSGDSSSPPAFSGLIKSFENKQATPSPFDQSSMQARQSELFLQIFLEFWMNHGGGREGTRAFTPLGQDYFLPSVDHVRVVRMLVKHLHVFMNVNMNNNLAITSHNEMDEVSYRALMPESIKLFKRRLYWFIHHCFAHWPLDPTFRFILETWLSYIQPWRYLTWEQISPSRNVRNVGSMLLWKPFIHHNLLFYTVMLQEFLNRAEKLNLRSGKDSQLFYRVTKVFSQEHLMYIVNRAEHDLWSFLSSMRSGFVQRSRSPKPHQYLHFMELQIPGTLYRPLWMEENINNIRHLLYRVEETLRSLREPEGRNVDQNGGWFRTKMENTLNWLQDVFAIDEQYWLTQNENSKAQEHLEQVSKHLRKLFQIEGDTHETTIPWSAEVVDRSSPSSHARPQKGSIESLPDCKKTERGLELTALGKYQMANGLRRFDIQYSGDPDLQPVRSYEVVFLVRSLHKLSTFLNQKFGAHLSNVYSSPGWRGSLARYLSPSVQRPRILSPVKHVQHPVSGVSCEQPKISLRYLATYRSWAQLLFFYCFISWVFNRPWLAVFLVLVMFVYMFVSHIHAIRTNESRSRTTSDTWE